MDRNQELWSGEVGTKYAQSAQLNHKEVDALWWPMLCQSRLEIDKKALKDIPKDAHILEVGCGVGNQLNCLQELGFYNLWGCDINETAVKICRERGFPADCCCANRLPYIDESFDMIYTSALLIHVPQAISGVVRKEIARVARHWIYGYEYYSPEWVSRSSVIGGLYPQGVPEFTFKAPFADLYLKNNPEWSLVVRERIQHQDGSNNEDEAFLLKRIEHEL